MNFELARILIALIGTGIAAYQDQKTSFVNESLVYSMIVIGVFLNIATLDISFIISSIGIALIVFAIGYFFYRIGQLGGGDVLLFFGLALLLPQYPKGLIDFLPQSISNTLNQQLMFMDYFKYPFILSIIVSGLFFALLGTTLFYLRQLLKRKLKPDYKNAAIIVVFIVAFMFFISRLTEITLFKFFFYMALLISGAILYIFKEQIMEEVVIKNIRIKDIEEEDIIAVEKIPLELVKEYNLGRVLTKKEVEKLKKIEKEKGIHYFPVCKVLPRLVPYLFLGLIVSLLIGDLFIWIVLF